MIRLKVVLFRSEEVNGPEQSLSVLCPLVAGGKGLSAPTVVCSCAALQAPSEIGYAAQGGCSAVSRAYEKENPTSQWKAET